MGGVDAMVMLQHRWVVEGLVGVQHQSVQGMDADLLVCVHHQQVGLGYAQHRYIQGVDAQHHYVGLVYVEL